MQLVLGDAVRGPHHSCVVHQQHMPARQQPLLAARQAVVLPARQVANDMKPCKTCLQLHIRDLLADGHASCAVDDFHADGRFALGLEDVVDQVLRRKVDIAAAVWIVLTEHALRVQTAQTPVARTLAKRCQLSACYQACWIHDFNQHGGRDCLHHTQH